MKNSKKTIVEIKNKYTFYSWDYFEWTYKLILMDTFKILNWFILLLLNFFVYFLVIPDFEDIAICNVGLINSSMNLL
jgi:hypothetical protein